MKHFTKLLLIALAFTFVNKTKAQVDVGDSLALVDLYDSTDGPNWYSDDNWLTSEPVSTWTGVVVSNKKVVIVILSGNNLIGNMPESIGNLTSLRYLKLDNNQLSGNIPESIGNLSHLQTLWLFDNQLNGGIPESIGNLSDLYYLFLSNNQLRGAIPESVGNLTALQSLTASSNQLSGVIPESVGNLTALQSLYLNNNQLSGGIPESIGNLSNLFFLDLDDNQLSGSIPETIGNLSNLQVLYLQYNQLSGSIPESIGNLSYLYHLYINNNQLSGSIPESIGSISNLYDLYLNNNQLSGSIPESIGNLSSLNFLYLDYNQLSGSLPESIGNLSDLSYLYLNDNQLSGSMPESIGELFDLQYLDLSDNQLSGSIPKSIFNLSPLNGLYLYNNQLSGSIPESIGNLSNLDYLHLNNNYLSGTLPSSLLQLHSYTDIAIAANEFTFDGMEKLVQRFSDFTYSPQANIPIFQNQSQLYVSAGGTISNNTYYWYKDGELIATIKGDTTFTITEDGKYNVNVTNSICTALTLYSDTITTSILPLTFLNFTARLQNKNPVLNWSTSQEINTKDFIIQRSTDGSRFTNISTVKAKGNSSSISQYSFTDANITALNTNKVYYRLLQTDNDGKSNYSKTVALSIAAQNNFAAYPNPVKDVLHIQTDAAAVVAITNTEGKVVITKMINGNSEINVAALSAGLYYAKNISTGEVKKFVVVK